MARGSRGSGVKAKEGDYRRGGRQVYQDGVWRDVNVVHAGQRATLNGQEVMADGNGNWMPVSHFDRYSDDYKKGTPLGTYEIGGTTNTPASTGGGQNLPPSAAEPGTGPKGNEVGSDAAPETPGLQGPAAPEVRTNPDGVVQEGRDLSFRFPTRAEIEGYTGRTVQNPWARGGDSADDAVTMGRDPDEAAAIVDGGSVETVIGPEGVESSQITPGANYESSNSAFLDAPDSMSGLKAREADLGLVYASGQYYVNNPNAGKDGEPELLAIDGSSAGGENRQAIRDYKAGKIDPQDFFDTYVKGVRDIEDEE